MVPACADDANAAAAAIAVNKVMCLFFIFLFCGFVLFGFSESWVVVGCVCFLRGVPEDVVEEIGEGSSLSFARPEGCRGGVIEETIADFFALTRS